MVVVHVEDRHPLAGRPDDGVGGDGGVVEEAVAAIHRAGGVVPGRPAQAIGAGRPAEHEVDRRERDVDRRARSRIGPGDERRRGVETPEPGPAGRMRGFPHQRRDGCLGHALEHPHVGVGVGRQEGARQALRPQLRPGHLEEADESRLVHGGDRTFAVLGGFEPRKAAIGVERGPDPFGAFGDLIGRDRQAHECLDRDVVAEMRRRIDDLQRDL